MTLVAPADIHFIEFPPRPVQLPDLPTGARAVVVNEYGFDWGARPLE